MNEVLRQLEEHLKEALAQALGSMTSQTFELTVEADPQPVTLADPLIWSQPISPGQGRLWIAAGRELWSEAGQMTLSASGIDSVTDEDCQSTWQEVSSQVTAAFCALLTGDVKIEVTAGKAERAESEPASAHVAVFTAACNGSSWQLKAGWSKGLAELYDQPAAPAPQARSLGEGVQSKTFDLLLDVALPVCVSFGRTALEVREILKLTTGSIVELNRFMSEPVEVIVNDCVIARGEVVVINGNYGVRITQLSSREDRMKSGMAEAPTRVGSSK